MLVLMYDLVSEDSGSRKRFTVLIVTLVVIASVVYLSIVKLERCLASQQVSV